MVLTIYKYNKNIYKLVYLYLIIIYIIPVLGILKKTHVIFIFKKNVIYFKLQNKIINDVCTKIVLKTYKYHYSFVYDLINVYNAYINSAYIGVYYCSI